MGNLIKCIFCFLFFSAIALKHAFKCHELQSWDFALAILFAIGAIGNAVGIALIIWQRYHKTQKE